MNRFQLFFIFIRLPLDYVAILFAAISAYAIRVSETIIAIRKVNIGLDFESYIQGSIIIALLWILIFAFSGLYSTDPNRKFGTEINRILIACSTGFAAIAVVIFLRAEMFNSRFIVLAASILALVFVVCERIIIRLIQRLLYSLNIGRLNTIIIGDDESAKNIKNFLISKKNFGSNVVRSFNSFNSKVADVIIKLKRKIGIDEIIFTNQDEEKESIKILAFCEEHHITFKYSAGLFSTYAPQRAMSVIASIPIIEIRPTKLHGWGKILKRVADIMISFFLIIVLSPILIITALFVFIETGKPIIFKNERIGEKGKIFNTYKFRSMHQIHSVGKQFKQSKAALSYEEELIREKGIKEGPIYKIKDDPRVTKVGKIIRSWSVDELPQLFNVLFGTMSLVGPRPHQTREVEKYEPEHKKVLAIKPGITGLSQISGRANLTFEDEMKLDTFYIEHWSIWSDVFILIKTPFAVIKKEGAY